MTAKHNIEVRKATTAAEREAIFRFRYAVYVEEMGRPQKDANHSSKTIRDYLDDFGCLYGAFDQDGDVVGTIRSNYRRIADFGMYDEFYRTAKFSEQFSNDISITTRLMVAPSLRKTSLAVRLACHAYRDGLDNGIKLDLMDCNEPLLQFFKRLGYQQGFQAYHPEYGDVHVMHLFLQDLQHLKKMKSPFRRILLHKGAATPNVSGAQEKPDNISRIKHKKPNTKITNNWSNLMDYSEKIHSAFDEVFDEFTASRPIVRLMSGDITVEEYRWVLRQIFHHSRENPQLQALATVYFRGHEREVIKRFYKHASSEIGHDQLALNDLAALGVDDSTIPYENPLPATTALLSYCYYQIQNLDPVGYLGYLYFLEFTPTRGGAGFVEALKRAGVSDDAFSFLNDHIVVDVGHNNLMKTYLRDLVVSEHQANTVIYSMRVTGQLYANMLDQAMRQAEKPNDYGLSFHEQSRRVQLAHEAQPLNSEHRSAV